LKTSLPALGASPRNVTAVRLPQPWKALRPMLVTLSGIVMLVRLLQRRKALAPMLVTPSGIVILVKLLQKEKASSPMLMTGLPSMVAGIINSSDSFFHNH